MARLSRQFQASRRGVFLYHPRFGLCLGLPFRLIRLDRRRARRDRADRQHRLEDFAGGAARLDWGRFTRAGIAGEAVWVALYVGLGAAFADDILALADLLGSVSGLLAAVAVAAALGLWLRAALRQRGAH